NSSSTTPRAPSGWANRSLSISKSLSRMCSTITQSNIPSWGSATAPRTPVSP
ncbi:hypothetical protein BGZ82_010795, partial [Podila clonocystis]